VAVRPQKEKDHTMSFDDLGLHAPLLAGIASLGFTEPTPIQRAALPPALAGRDVIACAMTGSGKTAAFALPILQRLAGGQRGVTRALVLTPTRELAAQVEESLRDLGRHTKVRSAAVFGGVGAGPQERALRSGVDVVVATPGRLLDHMSQGNTRFDGLEVLVLDEADRMLDMGFLPDVRRILAKLPRRRQTLLFSATLPAPIVALSREVLSDPVRLDVETALVFTRTKHRANRLAAFLDKQGVVCDRIHGNRSQSQRQAALAAFKAGKLQVLVATDIAARGLDIEALPHVVNFDVPGQPDDYIHRVGRTARAQLTGHAITFASPEENGELTAIERAVGRRLERRRLEGFDDSSRPAERFEIPVGERIAAIRARKAEERARARAKVERQATAPGRSPAAGDHRPREREATGHASAPRHRTRAWPGVAGSVAPPPPARHRGGRRPNDR
jgi:ATP-dependent RNA helicase RhlE